ALERVGGSRRIELELRGVRHVYGAPTAPLLEAGLEIVRAALLRNLTIKSFSLGPLIPVETASSEYVAANVQRWEVNRHAGRVDLIRLIPVVARPELGVAVGAQAGRNIGVHHVVVIAVKVHYRSRVDRPDQVARGLVGIPERSGRHIERGLVRSRVRVDVGGMVAAIAPEDFPLIVDIVVDTIAKVVIMPGVGVADRVIIPRR